MTLRKPTYQDINISKLLVFAGVRYFEDAEVNGQPDPFGTLIPFRRGDMWCPVIDVETGVIKGWPQGTTAKIYYKVCDDIEVFFADEHGNKIAKWADDYVPRFLCIGEPPCGDYIVLSINEEGKIEKWKEPDISEEDIEFLALGDAIAAP